MENKFDGRDAELFDNVVFLVQASDQEYMSFWCDFAHESTERMHKHVSIHWKQESLGVSRVIGELDGRPITVGGRYARLDGQRVLFYDGISQLVDWKMIDAWIEYYAEKCMDWKRTGATWRHCNAENFHNCLNFIRKKKS